MKGMATKKSSEKPMDDQHRTGQHDGAKKRTSRREGFSVRSATYVVKLGDNDDGE